jgi:[acyl-carrier-protein] S-malonyltransferase
MKALKEACEKLRPGAIGVVNLPVSGAFHSPFMEPIIEEFRLAIEETKFNKPICPIYQNFTARPSGNIELIKKNLVDQLTHPVMWRHTILHMIEDGATEFTEIGPGNFLRGLVRKINKSMNTYGIS